MVQQRAEPSEVFEITYRGRKVKVENHAGPEFSIFMVELQKDRYTHFRASLDEEANVYWLEDGIRSERADEIGRLIEAYHL